MPPRTIARFFLALAAASLMLGGGAGRAAPHDAKVVSIEQIDCNGAPCARGPVHQNELTGGVLRIKVSAAADLGLEWVRLEAQNPGDPRWYCLEFWNANSATTFTQTRIWNTAHWTDPRKVCAPADCSHCIETSPHHHGAPTKDAQFSVRVTAREQGAEVSHVVDDSSQPITFRVQNPPSPPAWQSDPAAGSDDQGNPAVSLVWAPAQEENAPPPSPNGAPPGDVREYRFLRTDPNGQQFAFAISSTHPETQGCRHIASIGYSCADTAFPAGAHGTYTYAIATVRAGFSGPRCKLSNETCVIGALGAPKTVTLSASPGQHGSAVPSGNASASPSSATIAARAPVAVAPTGFAAAPDQRAAGAKSKNPLPAIVAAIALAAALSAAVWRWRIARAAAK